MIRPDEGVFLKTSISHSPAPLVSVVIPAFNAEKFIDQTLDSIFEQELQDFEVVVVDDGSTDATAERVQSRPEPNVFYVATTHSGGPATPRNVGIRKARGKYISLFDSDDVMLPGKLSLSLGLLEENPQCGLVFTDFHVVDEEGRVVRSNFLAPYTTLHSIPYQPLTGKARLLEASLAFKGLVFSNFIGTSGVVARKSALQNTGGFCEDVMNADDKLMWLRIAREHDIIFVPETFHLYRHTEDGITSRNVSEKTQGLATVLEKVEKWPLEDRYRKEIRRQKMALWFEDGKSHFDRYDLGTARKSFVRSISYACNRQSIKFLLLSFLGESIIVRLRKIKNTIEGLYKGNEGA